MTFNVTTVDQFPNRVEVQGTLEGTATGGAYKVPCHFIYPKGATTPNNVGLVEAINTVCYEASTANALHFEAVQQAVSKEWLVETEGYSFFAVMWDKNAVDRNAAATASPPTGPVPRTQPIPFDDTWVIAAGTDAPEIIRDASLFLRTPTMTDPDTLLPPAAPAASSGVIGSGLSQTGELMREYAMASRNSGLGGGMPNSLVFEGIIPMQAGSAIRESTTDAADAFLQYSFSAGAPPASEGAHINFQTENDVQFAEGFNARVTTPVSHYKNVEIAGVSHIPTEQFLLRPHFQNRAWYGPPMRAMVDAMKRHIVSSDALPNDVSIDGAMAVRPSGPLFVGDFPGGISGYPSGTTVNTYNLVIGTDGNATGGIRLPHINTIVGGACVGGPTAFHRGSLCPTLAKKRDDVLKFNAMQDCPPPPTDLRIFGGFEYFSVLGGFEDLFTKPKLRALYSTHGTYVGLVKAAAEYAEAQGWILPVDTAKYIADAASGDIGLPGFPA